ncbi:hypothetical protein NADFUDRAFT_52535 [Nadsonia fulvescens var. elongata DSM 6958]|uniref:Rab-GAP TBC domain-containing protein n=1 Tax=Nadsonia fulvescens var. elongata DSM 6958 TaxID=857566 RepID=A0A1E3PGZ8_9ASCO|nr:hypothetical protein NADFUDRAFT_52535 [Nadsonia fulvescens var. elongata DSM 6958]
MLNYRVKSDSHSATPRTLRPRVKSTSSQDIARDFYDVSLASDQRSPSVSSDPYHLSSMMTLTSPSTLENPKLRKPLSLNGLRYHPTNNLSTTGSPIPSSRVESLASPGPVPRSFSSSYVPRGEPGQSLHSGQILHSQNNVSSRQRLHRVVSHDVLLTSKDTTKPKVLNDGPVAMHALGSMRLPNSVEPSEPQLRRFRSYDRLAPIASAHEPSRDAPSGLNTRRNFKLPPLNIDHGYPNLRERPGTVNTQTNKIPDLKASSRMRPSDYNDDDEIVDNDSLWNVPLSPLLYIKTQQTNKDNNKNGAANARRPPMNPASLARSSVPNLGLANLSRDAQDLTLAFQAEKLHSLPKNYDRKSVSASSESSSSSRSSAGSLMSTVSTWTNYSSDNIHILKNVNAINTHIGNGSSPTGLTTGAMTRPSSLPPKTKTEERKHLKQYEQMMQRAAQAAKLRQDAELVKRDQHAQQTKEDETVWKNHVLPQWELAISERETREMWWRAVPVKMRDKIWVKCIGNTAAVEPISEFERCKVSGMKTLSATKMVALMNKIESDLNQTLPECGLFHKLCSPLRTDLKDVILALIYYQNQLSLDDECDDSGIVYYSEEITGIVGIFLLYLPPHAAFNCVINLTQNPNRPFLYAIHRDRQVSYSVDNGFSKTTAHGDYDEPDDSMIHYSTFLHHFSLRLPRLYNHFQALSLAPTAYFGPIVKPLFLNHFPLDIAVHLWDILFFEGDSFLIRLVLTVLIHAEGKLYADTKEEILSELEAGKLGFDNDDDLRVVELVRNSVKLL